MDAVLNTQSHNRYLLFQNQQWKQKNNIYNMFRINNKDNRTTPGYILKFQISLNNVQNELNIFRIRNLQTFSSSPV